MKVYIAGAGAGKPEWLTVEVDRLLRGARICIYAGSLVNPQILELLPADCERHDSAGLCLDRIIDLCVDAQRRNLDVVRLHTGEPSLYGAIGEQMNALAERGIEFEMIPGISAFQASAAALRCELTAPEIAQTVILTRAAGRTPLPPEQELARLAEHKATLCIYLSTENVSSICAQLRPFYGEACPAAVVYHASWPDEQIFRGTLETLPQLVETAGIRRTALILVGQALARPRSVSRLYDASFSHGYRGSKES
jgi:precorrin-4/cobalt-precorrin-4 C11-methyltransferase